MELEKRKSLNKRIEKPYDPNKSTQPLGMSKEEQDKRYRQQRDEKSKQLEERSRRLHEKYKQQQDSSMTSDQKKNNYIRLH